MEIQQLNESVIYSNSIDNGGYPTSSSPVPHPNYSSRAVQEALEHLASIDLIELCNEAKVEHCRATRDLRSCGRYVHYALNSCGHASLCAECSQRCDLCPICRIPTPKSGNRLRLRLYYECIEAGLISKRCDERFQEKEDGEKPLTADVQRLYSLFDVAIENNLVSLICHYVTDVCMDESAVSSDPVVAFLLDEVVVKDWCKRTFGRIITELQEIYELEVEEMKNKLSLLLKFLVQMTGITNVLEVLESSFKGTVLAQLHDLHHLQENILKTKQHMEIMMWCIRHQFLENTCSRYTNFTSWCSHVHERKLAAIKRSWPDAVDHSAESLKQGGSLFIEDALTNLETGLRHIREMGEELEVASLQKNGSSLNFRSQIEGVAGCYPFENLRAAVDILFLYGSSDLVVAKQAIFLYYLFDRHWTMPDDWTKIIDDFAATFVITRHALLESCTFFLLDDHTDEALQEACGLLPEISGHTTHPKIAQVLLERQNPDTALMVLRWSGRDGGSQLVSLTEAVTAVRVRVECGLLTEAFTHQRMLCTKFRERKLKYSGNAFDDLKGEHRNWMEVLVTEICCLCIRRNLVDRIIELPWNCAEEKYLHKCLLDYAIDDPSTIIGSLLVVYYIQRYRYTEAHQVDRKLQSVEQEFVSQNSTSEEVLSRMRSFSHWRAGLVDKCIELLPEVQQQQVKTGNLPDVAVTSCNEVEMLAKSFIPELVEPKQTSLLVPSSADASLVLWTDHRTPDLKHSFFGTPTKLGGLPRFELGSYGSPSILHERLFANAERGQEVGNGRDFKFDGMSTRIHRASPMNATQPTPFKEINGSSSRLLPNGHHQKNQYNKILPEVEQNGFINHFQNTNPPDSRRVIANPVTTPISNRGLIHVSAEDLLPSVSSKRVQSDRDGRPWNTVSSDDPMDLSWSYGERGFAVDDRNADAGLRWRSDETSEDEEQSPGMAMGLASSTASVRGIRRSRFARR